MIQIKGKWRKTDIIAVMQPKVPEFGRLGLWEYARVVFKTANAR